MNKAGGCFSRCNGSRTFEKRDPGVSVDVGNEGKLPGLEARGVDACVALGHIYADVLRVCS